MLGKTGKTRFYSGKEHTETASQEQKADVGSGQSADMSTILKLLENPETAGLLKALVTAMNK